MDKLLTRDEFRESVFKRDGYKCVFCKEVAKDAHHILERRLFPANNGGYYLNNGISVCAEHHLQCESTEISVEQAREAAKITKKILPEHLYDDEIYTKWGDPVLPNGQRLKGELFHDESVQKIIANKLHLYTHWVRYPRTYHCPWSESIGKDDRVVKSMDEFVGRRVIVSVKMDGESTSCYKDHIHARSLDSRSNTTRDWVKNFWSGFRHEIPEGWRICGENLFAKHSLFYKNLPSYFMGFSVWNDKNECLSWDETKEWFQLLGIVPVEVLYDGIYDEKTIRALYDPKNWDTMEGYVIRIADKFSYRDFSKKVAKTVRSNHIRTVKHWMFGQELIKNEMVKT